MDVEVDAEKDQRPEKERESNRQHRFRRLDVREVVVRRSDDDPDHEVDERAETDPQLDPPARHERERCDDERDDEQQPGKAVDRKTTADGENHQDQHDNPQERHKQSRLCPICVLPVCSPSARRGVPVAEGLGLEPCSFAGERHLRPQRGSAERFQMRASAFPDSGLSRRRLAAIPVCSRHSRASRVSPPPPTRSRKGIRVSQQRRAWRPLRGSRLARLNHCPARAQPRPLGGWAQRHASGSVLGGSFWPCTAAESVYLVWEGSGLCGSWSARERVVPGAIRTSAACSVWGSTCSRPGSEPRMPSIRAISAGSAVSKV